MRVMRRAYAVEGWGTGELWLAGDLVVHHVLPGSLDASAVVEPLQREPAAGVGSTLCRRFSRHLTGEPTAYADIAVDLDWATPFQAQLVAALRAVPWGEIVSYGELAALAGRPRAARAAGALCAGNQLSLIVPCHRVVAADGVGGYGSAGVAVKRRLLALEGVIV